MRNIPEKMIKRNPCFSGRRAFPRGPAGCRKFQGNAELEYSLITVKLPVLYDRCRQALIREGECHYPEGDRIYQEEDARPGEP